MKKFDWKTGRQEIKKQLGSEAAKQLCPSLVGQHWHADNLCLGKPSPVTTCHPLPEVEGNFAVLSPRERVRERVKHSFAKQTVKVFSPFTSHFSRKRTAFTLAEVFHPAEHSNRTAFTLAEVLITLGIIGIVAALTIPTLIKKYEKQVTATRAKQAYSLISQAIKLSEIDNGPAEDWAVSSEKGLPYTEKFLNKFILPYLKAEFCGDSNSSDMIKKCGATVSVNGKNYFLANGTAVSFVPIGAFNNKTELGILDITIDTNGPKKPNFFGNDQFYFEYYPNIGFKPYAAPANCSRDEILKGTCQFDGHFLGCKKVKNDDEDIRYRHGCTLLLMMDSWQFKDDYPW